jgi:hypothetical protein
MFSLKRFEAAVLVLFLLLAVATFSFAFAGFEYARAAATSNFTMEVIPGPQCFDGLDNDGDGFIDFPDDPDCDSTSDNSESEPAVAGPGPSGGGGGGMTIAPTTSVSFSGRAYPGSLVILLKDAQITVSTVAGPDAKFSVGLSGISAGRYNFALYGESTQGRRSRIYTFPLVLTKGAITNISGIIIAPTIDVDKSVVRQGNMIAIFGEAAPDADVTIAVSAGGVNMALPSNQDFFNVVKADSDGAYLYYFDTSPLILGDHGAKSRAVLDPLVSEYSTVVAFTVGTTDAPRDALPLCGKADMNCDGRVNLVDFSIAAFWYQRSLEGDIIRKEAERLNGDGKIDIVDFSIMAFYWTG